MVGESAAGQADRPQGVVHHPQLLGLRRAQRALGEAAHLGAETGKIVIVHFFATWCEPCRDEMPSLRTLKQRMDGVRELVDGVGRHAPF